MADIAVGGLTPFTTIDFPGKLSAVVFCQGCAWNCPYCHNAHLRARGTAPERSWDDVRGFLEKRRGKLDAVVFSGGEPLLQASLPAAIDDSRTLGFAIGLHTGGTPLDRLLAVLPKVDWVGFDVKTLWQRYDAVTGARGSGDKARAALAAIIGSGVDFEARTTVDPSLHNANLLQALADDLEAMGVRHYALQRRQWHETTPVGADLAALDALFDPAFTAHIGLRFENLAVRNG